jgi:hypothetical protein
LEVSVESLAFLLIGGVMPSGEDEGKRRFPAVTHAMPTREKFPEFIPAKRLGADAPFRLQSGDELFRGGHGRFVVAEID